MWETYVVAGLFVVLLIVVAIEGHVRAERNRKDMGKLQDKYDLLNKNHQRCRAAHKAIRSDYYILQRRYENCSALMAIITRGL